MAVRATRTYEHETSPDLWRLTTKDSSNTTLQVEEMTDWTYSGSERTRTYSKSIASTVVYSELETQVQFSDGYRRTSLIVDPGGSDERETTWEWTDSIADAAGLVLTRVDRPDGSWTTYEYTYDDENLEWTITTTTPWKCGETTLSIARKFAQQDGHYYYRLVDETATVDSTTVSHTAWTYSGGTTTQLRYLDGSAHLDTTYDWHYADIAGTRFDGAIVEMDAITKPDSTSTEYSYSASNLSAASYPSSHSLSSGSTYRLLRVAEVGSSGEVEDESTRVSTLIDGLGRPLYSETEVWHSSAWAGPISWTSWSYDDQGRNTGVWSADGSYTKTEYSACCERKITDSQGIETFVTRDAIGRIVEVQRAGVQTDYDYSAAFVIERTVHPVGDTSPSIVTETILDPHQRPHRIVTNVGTADERAQLFFYGVSGGGEMITTYSDYGASATSGEVGVRDRITEYFCDRRIKKISGATVIEKSYDYGYSSTGLSTTVTTGPSGHASEEVRNYDWLGRITQVDRDGWASSGTATVTSSYAYDDSTTGEKGRLIKVQSTGQPATLYEYDDLGHVHRTVIDVNDDGNIDLGGPDRISETESTIVLISSNWWRVRKSFTYPSSSSSTRVQTSEQRVRLRGYTGSTSSTFTQNESVTIDKLNSNNQTTRTVQLNRSTQTRTETVDVPESSVNAVNTYENGLLTSSMSSEGVTTAYGYDELNRRTDVTDARGNTTTTAYDSSNRVSSITNEAGNITTYGHYVTGDTGATTAGSGVWPGRIKSVSNPAAKQTYLAYTDRGEIWRTWGDVPYPTEQVYDEHGRRTSLKTYRGGTAWDDPTWPSSPGTADETAWTYHDATGLLNRKTYDDATHVDYTYTSDGKLVTRVWARGVTASYSYYVGAGSDPFTGELKAVEYSDSTTDLGYTYDRMGRTATVADATGSRTFGYDVTTLAPTTETFATGNLFAGLITTQTYQGSGSGLVPGRWSGIKLGTSSDDDAYYAATYGYDALGRLSSANGPGLPAGGAEYSFLLNGSDETGLQHKVRFKDGSGNVKAWSERSYEADRDLIAKVTNTFGDDSSTDVISKYEYVNDARSRRQGVIYSGEAFGSGFIDDWSYNDRNELLGTDRKSGTSSSTINTTDVFESTADAADRRYLYDSIGNRTMSDIGVAIEDPNEPTWSYERNSLNQYSTVVVSTPFMRQFFEHDDDGNRVLQFAVGDINGDGAVDVGDLSQLLSNYGDTCSSHAGLTNAEFTRADVDGDCVLTVGDLAGLISGFGVAAAAGNFVKFTWDAENRLTEVEPLPRSETTATIPAAYRRLKFAYDFRGRRVEKLVYKRDANNTAAWASNPIERRRFVWNGWLMLRETIEIDDAADGTFESTRVKSYTWGRDLGGSFESAGGIGGLLAVYDDNGSSGDLAYLYMYDANGNVGQVVDWAAANATASLKATYEYDAFGNVIDSDGSYSTANSIRFSTKYWDDESRLGYWGYRYYDGQAGRWLNRDPLGEVDDGSLYCYVLNDPTQKFDPLGDTIFTKKSDCFNYCVSFFIYCRSCAGASPDCTTTLGTCLGSCNKQRSGGYIPYNPTAITGPCTAAPPVPGAGGGTPGSGSGGGPQPPVLPQWLDTLLNSLATQVTGSELCGAVGLGPDLIKLQACLAFIRYAQDHPDSNAQNDADYLFLLIKCKLAAGNGSLQ